MFPISVFGLALTAQAGFFFSFLGVFGSSEEYLAQARPLNSQTMPLLELEQSKSRGGGDIVVEDNALVAEGETITGDGRLVYAAGADHISTYVVHAGDSLSEIAEMFGVSVNTVRWANDLGRSGTIREGQTLVILPVSGVKHKIKSGDTLVGLAKKYKAETAEIAEFNGLDNSATLIVGDELIIPDGEIIDSVPAKSSSGLAVVAKDYYLRPIKGGKKTQGLHGYNGVDLATYVGAPVYAAFDGEVVLSKSSGWNGGYGNYIVIKHPNKTQTLYAHLSVNRVGVGGLVTRGQIVGEVGSTGKSTGPHLHFEVRGAKNPF